MASEDHKNTARRDLLLQLQERAQQRWAEDKVFECDAPEDAAGSGQPGEKFFANFPYPYMNGMLHLGHAFSLSKMEFACAYRRLKGERVLMPFAYHCTGMPIKACADKLKREIATFGNPPQFPSAADAAEAALATAGEPASANGATANNQGNEDKDPTKFRAKKSKAVAKAGTAAYQWQIMQMSGIPEDTIAQFQDPQHWLNYFPPLAEQDLRAMGLGADWRRSFITTDMNPYYDAFIRWQFNTLRKLGKVVKDKRYAVYSPLDGQPCADHDRASGEGAGPQEYVLVKMEVISPFTGKLEGLQGKKVFLGAATLRPETMYGQTNAWALPEGDYGAFQTVDGDVLVTSHRAALNLSYQGYFKVEGRPDCLCELKGTDLLGLSLKSPLTSNDVIYVLPMLSILMDKGTGVVTSVPSDSPDDYMALMDLKNKAAFRAKFGLHDEWVMPFEVLPVLNIPEFGDTSAVKVCNDLKIKSQNDKDKLAEAKKLTYLKGFVEGVMVVGPYKGQKVADAKPLIRKDLLDAKEAIIYCEPEKKVMSRSGDECVVALTDQWYVTYGEEEWRDLAMKALSKMELYHEEARNQFEHTLGWLNQWACSRSFGLGTRLPWDPQYLIESLSDSTIYMAYYTIAHTLQRGDIYGQPDGKSIRPEQLTDEVFEHIFRDGPAPNTDIPEDVIAKMRREFNYWYPFDLRVSGKDLIQNHLTFSIYNHTALFPEEKWPRAFRCNGHLLLNSEKMSKSTGNFKTLREAIAEYSADAMRFALADAGDNMDDANFVELTANAAILKLTKELAWMEENVAANAGLREGGNDTFADRVFANELNIAVSTTVDAYEHMMFREALKAGFYDLQNARDEYRISCGSAGMRQDLVLRFIEVQTLLLVPLTPHFCEHVWGSVLNKSGTVLRAGLPSAASPDYTLQHANKYLQDTITAFRKALIKQQAPKKGAKKPAAAPEPITTCRVFVAERFIGWQEQCLNILSSHYDIKAKQFAPDAEIMEAIKSSPLSQQADFKNILKMCMPFVKFKKDEALAVGAHALDTKLPFEEQAILLENADYVRRALGLENLHIASASNSDALSAAGVDAAKVAAGTPGSPVAIFS
eukprot:jgi/Chlat1/8994/Chrsp94S08281